MAEPADRGCVRDGASRDRRERDMCDTLVALGNSTQDGSVILGKNSDRPPNEAQVVRRVPRAKHPEGATVKCTHIEIPQARETLEVLLSCPFWIWGAEMGANECGVAIGNEAVWSKESYADTGLLGMDLLRLGLERGNTARGALEVMVELLEKHGQGGNCFLDMPLKYHNSFIIADLGEAWTLETADRYWVAKRVTDIGSISNGYTIGSEWDLGSPDVVQHAIEKGWCESEEAFDFARCYGDPGMREIVHCVERVSRSAGLLQQRKGDLTTSDMMDYLKDHNGCGAGEWNPDRQVNTICMHAGPAVLSQSTASYVAHLTQDVCTHWLTGGSTPCISVYIPFYSGTDIPEALTEGRDAYEERSYWWRHERLVRRVEEDYPHRAGLILPELARMQSLFLEEDRQARQEAQRLASRERVRPLQDLTSRCVVAVSRGQEDWLRSAGTAGTAEPTGQTKSDYLDFLRTTNEAAGLRD